MRLCEIIAPDLSQTEVEQFANQVKQTYGLIDFSLFLVGAHDSAALSGKIIELGRIHVDRKKQGTGTAAMQALCRFADQHGAEIRLMLASKGDLPGTTSRNRLIGFYRRFGFVQNKGRHRNFTTSAEMIRMPHSSQVSAIFIKSS